MTPLSIAEIGSFYIAGREAELRDLPTREIVFTKNSLPVCVDPNGTFEVEQMYVRFVRLSQPTKPVPIGMWHGGGLMGTLFESTPDGRSGWEMFFLRAGYNTFISDAVERGRATWARYPEIFSSEPFFRTKREMWELFRIGAPDSYATRTAHVGSQFPVEAFDAFMRQSAPRWQTNDEATLRAYERLVREHGPMIVIGHSGGGTFAQTIALRAPEFVRAVVLIEPGGVPDYAHVDLTTLRNTPHLVIWGDQLDTVPFWSHAEQTVDSYRLALQAAGVRADRIDLPAVGESGNSHLLMVERNSDRIASLIADWLDAQNV